MKIALLGGSGHIGRGFALRWGSIHEVIIGSRDGEKARLAAKEYSGILENYNKTAHITGADNRTAAETADVIVLAIKYGHIQNIIETICPVLKEQIVVSVVVPMEKDRCYIIPDTENEHIVVDIKDSAYAGEYFCYTRPPGGSAAEEIARLLPEGTRLVSGFHNVPGNKLEDIDLKLDYDIAICGNDMHSKNIICELVADIPSMRARDAGPLEASSMIEPLTPLLINIAARNRMKDVGVKFI
jgi:hypothetical protein